MFKSLRSKFILVILALIITVVGQVLLSSITQRKLIENQQELSQSYNNVGLVHELERDLVDLQRNLLVYKETGSKNSIARFEELMENSQTKLAILEQDMATQTTIQLEATTLKRMQIHLKDYNENFKNVLRTRESQATILDTNINPAFEELRTISESLIDENTKHEIKYLVALAEKNLNRYQNAPDFEYVEKLNASLALISELIASNPLLQEKLSAPFAELKRSVAQLILITRGYVFLVNVVMAGSANEFLILTQTLRESVITQQKQLNAETSSFAIESEQKNNGAALLAILMLLFISIFLARKILSPINILTSVFAKLAKGEELSVIPETHRKDEIGALAKAAQVFQQKNQQTSMLLLEAREMNTRKEELNAALEVEKEKAESAAKSKAMFLANMSHEIRTPMNGIIGLVQLLSKTRLNEQQSHYLKKVAFSGQIMMNVINDILDFSKIEAGKLEIDYIEFEVDELIENLIANLMPKLYEKDIHFSVHFSPLIPKQILGDPLRISQIVLNLCNNAIKFTHKGSITLSFDYQPSVDKDALIIQVKDTGIGMSARQLEGIFDAFSQADGSTSRKYGGTGLGLSIVKQLSQLMDGHVNVDSTEGKGSTFTVTLAVTDHSKLTILDQGHPKVRDLEILYIPNESASFYPEHFLMQLKHQVTITSWDKLEHAINSSPATKIEVLIDAADITTLDEHQELLQRLLKAKNNFLFLCHHNSFELQHHIEKQYKSPVLSHPFSPSRFILFLEGRYYTDSPLQKQHEDMQNASSQTKLSGHILIVEDNTINQLVASHMVQSFGLTFELANNGQEGVEMITSGKDYQLVLMDIQMPVMDGYNATKHLRQAGYSDLIICGLSANAMEKDFELAKQAGMNDYLTKPIEIGELEKILRKYLEKN